ncbi:Methyl-CpG-binding domain protein 4 [Rhizophlyctis rosea]|uniref:Methyl-CpG-binding domain protein 4 n=1 Tax=Rhizophlyctis rosea TaxID=64517 RepID=A0AAD5X5G3_9FUNG|nr:Methyl-CpG-binding domain protein 4 [Rhizophlyctis rosea]
MGKHFSNVTSSSFRDGEAFEQQRSAYLPSPPSTPHTTKKRKRSSSDKPLPDAPIFASTGVSRIVSKKAKKAASSQGEVAGGVVGTSNAKPRSKRAKRIVASSDVVSVPDSNITVTPPVSESPAEDDIEAKPSKKKKKVVKTKVVTTTTTTTSTSTRKRKSKGKSVPPVDDLPPIDASRTTPSEHVNISTSRPRTSRITRSTSTTESKTTTLISPTPTTTKIRTTRITRKKNAKVTSPYFAAPEPLYDWERIAAASPPDSVVHLPQHKPKYKPLRSPQPLVQEYLYTNPWMLLVATIFLNKTTGTAARPKMWEFFNRWPSPEACAAGKFGPYVCRGIARHGD